MIAIVRILLAIPFLFMGCVVDDGGTEPGETDASTTGTATSASSTSTMGGDSTTGPDAATSGSSGEGGGSTTGAATTTGAVTSTGTESESAGSTGASLGGAYDQCDEDDECVAGLRCSQAAGYCTPACDMAKMDCPPPPSGDAVASCVKSSRGSLCRLSCSVDETTCPDGMFCNGMFPGPPPACDYP